MARSVVLLDDELGVIDARDVSSLEDRLELLGDLGAKRVLPLARRDLLVRLAREQGQDAVADLRDRELVGLELLGGLAIVDLEPHRALDVALASGVGEVRDERFEREDAALRGLAVLRASAVLALRPLGRRSRGRGRPEEHERGDAAAPENEDDEEQEDDQPRLSLGLFRFGLCGFGHATTLPDAAGARSGVRPWGRSAPSLFIGPAPEKLRGPSRRLPEGRSGGRNGYSRRQDRGGRPPRARRTVRGSGDRRRKRPRCPASPGRARAGRCAGTGVRRAPAPPFRHTCRSSRCPCSDPPDYRSVSHSGGRRDRLLPGRRPLHPRSLTQKLSWNAWTS